MHITETERLAATDRLPGTIRPADLVPAGMTVFGPTPPRECRYCSEPAAHTMHGALGTAWPLCDRHFLLALAERQRTRPIPAPADPEPAPVADPVPAPADPVPAAASPRRIGFAPAQTPAQTPAPAHTGQRNRRAGRR
jgi:hypothetical protein